MSYVCLEKPENILLSSTRDNADLKLADFGLSLEIMNQPTAWYGTYVIETMC